MRLADTQKDGARDGGIHRVAAGFQDAERFGRRQRMRRRDHAVCGEDRGTSGQVEISHGGWPSGEFAGI